MKTPAPTEQDRPLVTFALFAYNQEQYIREAVEGAFAQTYEPLEIILSDDCSSDRTFEIMEEMVAAYEGPHRVQVRRNVVNVGTALHVQLAFEHSTGQLFVVAAGDDISSSARVDVITKAWVSEGCPEGAIHSGREVFREGYASTIHPPNHTPFSQANLEGFANGYWLPAAAPTCAFTRGVFERFAPLLGGSIIEDVPLMLRVAILGRLISCEEPLVRQRLHAENSGTGYQIDRPGRWNRFIISKLVAFRTMQRDIANWEGEIDAETRFRVETHIVRVLHSASRLILPEKKPIGRMGKLIFAYKIISSPAVARTLRLRLEYMLSFFGYRFHLQLKAMVRGKIKRFGRGL